MWVKRSWVHELATLLPGFLCAAGLRALTSCSCYQTPSHAGGSWTLQCWHCFCTVASMEQCGGHTDLAGEKALFCWSSLTLPSSQATLNQCSSTWYAKHDIPHHYLRVGWLLKNSWIFSGQIISIKIFFMSIPISKSNNYGYADFIKWNIKIWKLKSVALFTSIFSAQCHRAKTNLLSRQCLSVSNSSLLAFF